MEKINNDKLEGANFANSKEGSYKENYIEGRNAVIEALKSTDDKITVDKLFVLKDCHDGPINTIVREAKKQGIITNFVSKDRLNQLSASGKHQGVIAVCAAYSYSTLDEILNSPLANAQDAMIIVLDNIEDPMNLGGILRTANIAGAAGLIIHNRHAALLTPSAVKASAGAVSYTPVAKCVNISNAIKELQDRGYWCICSDMDGELMYNVNMLGKIALVIGNEGKGVSRLVREACDHVAAIPMSGDIESLNASVSAGILMYEALRQRRFKK